MKSSHFRKFGRQALKTAYFASRFSLPKTHRLPFRVIHLPSGEPAVKGAPCHASIAHTRGWAVGAVAEHAIGVDIEHIRNRPYATELLHYIVSPDEYIDIVFRETNMARILTLLWVIKESVRKCLGIRRPVDPKELIIFKRMRKIFFVRWRKNDAIYKVRVNKREKTLIARAFPAHVREQATYRVIRSYANIHIQ